MPKRGKKYQAAAATLEAGERLETTAALETVKQAAYAGFDETVEAVVRLGVDPRRADQVVRATVVLPHGTGKSVRVLALAQGEKAREAEEAGADFVGTEYIANIEGGWVDFDVAVVTPDLMKDVAKLGRILGPRGLMPNPKAGTVTMDIARAVQEAKAGKIEFRVDRTGNVHAPVGKVSFPVEHLKENLDSLMDAILRNRPSGAKGKFVRGIGVSSTMGPGIKLDENQYRH